MTQLEDIEDQLTQQLALQPTLQGSPRWVERAFTQDGWHVRVAHGRARAGGLGYRYWIGVHRVERPVLQTLLCHHALCPQKQKVQQRWQDFIGQARPKRHEEPALFVRRLAEEVNLEGPDGQTWTARRAKLRVNLTCPEGAHPPRQVQVDAWDLFSQSGYVAGGLAPQAMGTAERLPLFLSLDDAKRWLEVKGQAIAIPHSNHTHATA